VRWSSPEAGLSNDLSEAFAFLKRMPSQRLPSLDGLLVFGSAARQRSFTRVVAEQFPARSTSPTMAAVLPPP
jgi:hypothetical protein